MARKLQWGHVFSDVEMPIGISCYREENCFNGATSFQTWKSEQQQEEKEGIGMLQWVHVFSDVEMSRPAQKA